MDREETPHELLIMRVLFALAVVLILTALIMLGMFTDSKKIGPCEQYQSQEAFELCADSVYNG
jgi:hypothetical protein